MLIVMFFGAIVGLALVRCFQVYAVVLAALICTVAVVAIAMLGYLSPLRALLDLAGLQIGLQGGALLGFFVKYLELHGLSSGLKKVSLLIVRR
jgi:hypothetical protein